MSAAFGGAPGKRHVFLSHAGADTAAARQFAEIPSRNAIDLLPLTLRPNPATVPVSQAALGRQRS